MVWWCVQDRNTGEGRGFAFIDFYNHDDAAKAIEALNGTGFDSLILNVDWARPSADGGGGGGGGGIYIYRDIYHTTVYICTHTHTDTHTPTQPRTHTHTSTHTHIQIYIYIYYI